METRGEPKGTVSRRRMLKRIGAGAAVAWTAPILTSIHTPAFAQGSAECASCPPFDCTNPELCRTVCGCAPHHGDAGGCLCWGPNGNCPVDGPDICATDQDCMDI